MTPVGLPDDVRDILIHMRTIVQMQKLDGNELREFIRSHTEEDQLKILKLQHMIENGEALKALREQEAKYNHSFDTHPSELPDTVADVQLRHKLLISHNAEEVQSRMDACRRTLNSALDHIANKLNTLAQMYEGVPIPGYDTPPIPAELEQQLMGPSGGIGYPKAIGKNRIGRSDTSRDGDAVQRSITDGGGGQGNGPAAGEKGHVTADQDNGDKEVTSASVAMEVLKAGELRRAGKNN